MKKHEDAHNTFFLFLRSQISDEIISAWDKINLVEHEFPDLKAFFVLKNIEKKLLWA